MNDNFRDGSETRNQKLVEKYIMANKLHRMYLERELNKSGVYRSQHQILMFISKFPNASQKEIANRHHVHGNDCSLPEEDGKGRIYQPRDG